jgi:hypothetical protein
MTQKIALDSAKAFLLKLQQGTPPKPLTGHLKPDRLVIFSKGDQGLTLINEAARAYGEVVDNLYGSLTDERRATVSRKSIESQLQEAALLSLRRPPDDAVERVALAMKRLLRGLSQRPSAWDVIFPVTGLAVKRRRRSFGRVLFQAANPTTLATIGAKGSRIIRAGTSPERGAFEVVYKDGLREALNGASIASVAVSAVDQESAERIARQVVRESLDALGFCDSLLTPRGISVAPSIDGTEREVAAAVVFQDDAGLFRPSTFRGRPVDLSALFRKNAPRMARQVSELLRVEQPSQMQRRILTSLCWVGRANGRVRAAEAFLFYLIALETLILGPDKPGELTYRLRVRGAHLIAKKNTASRKLVSDRIAELYGVRSAIVHKGLRDVSAEQLGSARLYASLAILNVLQSRRIRKGTDLETWFDSQVLK